MRVSSFDAGSVSRGISRTAAWPRGEGEEIVAAARACAACSTVQASTSIAGVVSTPLAAELVSKAMITVSERSAENGGEGEMREDKGNAGRNELIYMTLDSCWKGSQEGEAAYGSMESSPDKDNLQVRYETELSERDRPIRTVGSTIRLRALSLNGRETAFTL